MSSTEHRKTIKHVHNKGDFHELTFSTYRRLPLLTNDAWRTTLATEIDAAVQAEAMRLVAFVFMPEHVHLLVFPTTPKPDLGGFLARIKQPFSSEISARLTRIESPLLKRLTVRERPGKTTFRFWQEGPGFDRNLFVRAAILASIDYIHKNPVKRGLCDRPERWLWSSARYYLGDPPRTQYPGLPTIHGLPEGWE